jgi:hypothetical protein
VKQKRKTAIIFASKRKEAKRKRICLPRCEKSFFSLVFASEAKRKWNEAKRKRKRSERKMFKAKQSENSSKYALLILL